MSANLSANRLMKPTKEPDQHTLLHTSKRSSRKYSIRMQDRVTSITLRNNIVSLWIVLSDFPRKKDYHNEVSDFISDCMDTWVLASGKGLSDFVQDKMIESLLETSDYRIYTRILKDL